MSSCTFSSVASGVVGMGRVELLPSSLDRETAKLHALRESSSMAAPCGSMYPTSFATDMRKTRRLAQGASSTTAALAFSVGQARFSEGHTDVVNSVAFSPTIPTMLASGSADYTVALWDIGSMTGLAVLRGHTGSVTSIAFNRQALNIVCSRNLIISVCE